MALTIDVHHHILADFFWQETNNGAHLVGGIAPPAWDQVGMLSFMDDAGIDVAVTSISTPGIHVADDARAVGLRLTLIRPACVCSTGNTAGVRHFQKCAHVAKVQGVPPYATLRLIIEGCHSVRRNGNFCIVKCFRRLLK